MVDSFTSNRDLIQPLVGSDSGTWGGLLNNGVMAQLDLILGATQAITITVSDITLTTNQWNNAAIKLTGVLTGNHQLILPFNVNSSSVAVGGLFVVDNQTSGAFTVTVITAAAGSTGVVVPQGVRTYLYSDTTNVWYADDAKLQILPYNGNPNTHVAGTAASVNNPPSVVWDYTNFSWYVCTTTGNAAAAVWTNPSLSSATLTTPQGYLTPVSNTPIITGDAISATAIYYTPYLGAEAAIHNGSSIVPYTFTQLTLTLSTSQSSSNIYDIFLAYNSGTPVIGTGPSWAASGGSVAAGSCARGTGPGSTDLTRATPSGFLVNANSLSLIYNTGSGNNTITVAAGQGIYLGSIYIDGTAGQVTCHRSYGRNRKWGIWNTYNQTQISLTAGDQTGGAQASTGNFTPVVSASTVLTSFVGLATELINFTGSIGGSSNVSANLNGGIGINSTSVSTGFAPSGGAYSGALNIAIPTATYVQLPALGITNATLLIRADAGTQTITGGYFGNVLTAIWAG